MRYLKLRDGRLEDWSLKLRLLLSVPVRVLVLRDVLDIAY
jgi:hypothetical protein